MALVWNEQRGGFDVTEAYDPGAEQPTDSPVIARLRRDLRSYRQQVIDLETMLREQDHR